MSEVRVLAGEWFDAPLVSLGAYSPFFYAVELVLSKRGALSFIEGASEHPEQASEVLSLLKVEASAPREIKMWKVYLVECRDGKFYTGVTENLERRIREHSRRGSHFTSYNPAKELLYSKQYPTKFEAEKREAQIKRCSHAKKSALIKGDLKRLRDLSISRN